MVSSGNSLFSSLISFIVIIVTYSTLCCTDKVPVYDRTIMNHLWFSLFGISSLKHHHHFSQISTKPCIFPLAQNEFQSSTKQFHHYHTYNVIWKYIYRYVCTYTLYIACIIIWNWNEVRFKHCLIEKNCQLTIDQYEIKTLKLTEMKFNLPVSGAKNINHWLMYITDF